MKLFRTTIVFIVFLILIKATATSQEADIYIPNAFSPSGFQNTNALFYPLTEQPTDIDIIKFEIYDWSGNQVFNGNSIDYKWDGKLNRTPMPMGTYVYFLNIIDTNGEEVLLKGTVLLIR